MVGSNQKLGHIFCIFDHRNLKLCSHQMRLRQGHSASMVSQCADAFEGPASVFALTPKIVYKMCRKVWIWDYPVTCVYIDLLEVATWTCVSECAVRQNPSPIRPFLFKKVIWIMGWSLSPFLFYSDQPTMLNLPCNSMSFLDSSGWHLLFILPKLLSTEDLITVCTRCSWFRPLPWMGWH